MEARVLGIDLSDESTTLVYFGETEALTFKTLVAREKLKETWYVGDDAFDQSLGELSVTDRLLTLTAKHGTATIQGKKYHGNELLRHFLKEIIEKSVNKFDARYPDEIVISIPKVESNITNQIMDCFVDLGYYRSHIHIISRSESFIYYVMSQNKDMWTNNVGLFFVSDTKIHYYELRVHRGSVPNPVVIAQREDIHEGFDQDILSTPKGIKIADDILTSIGKEVLARKIFSSILLVGRCFSEVSWAENFMRVVCQRRKVYSEQALFAMGACYRGVDFASPKSPFHFTCICDGRLSSTVSLPLINKNKECDTPIARAGDNWYTASSQWRMIADGVNSLDFKITPLDLRKRRMKVVKISLDFLPKRPQKTRRIDVRTVFKDAQTMMVEIKDAGFGDIYPMGKKAHLIKEVNLWD